MLTEVNLLMAWPLMSVKTINSGLICAKLVNLIAKINTNPAAP